MEPAAVSPGSSPILVTRDLTKSFRSLIALKNHSVEVKRGEIVGVIGPNGSGKSTFFNLVTGFLRPNAGAVEFEGSRSQQKPPRPSSRAGHCPNLPGHAPVPSSSACARTCARPPSCAIRLDLLDAVLGTPRLRRASRGRDAARLTRLLDLVGSARAAPTRAPAICPMATSAGWNSSRALAHAAAPADAGRAGRRHECRPRRTALLSSSTTIRDRYRARRHRRRARHGSDHEPLRAHPGARPRRGHLRGHARRGAGQSARPGGLSWPCLKQRARRRAAADGRTAARDQRLRVNYGAVAAIKGVSLHVAPGEVVALLGANGAGKSTMLRTISGLVRPRGGTIRLRGERIDRLPPARIVRLRRRPLPGGSARLRLADGGGESAARRRTRADRPTASRKTASASTRCFRSCASACTSRPARSPAASSRCWRSARALMARPASAAARRAVARPCAAAGARRFSGRSAELKRQGVTMLLVEQNIVARARPRRPRLCAAHRRGQPVRTRRGTAGDYERVAAAYLGARPMSLRRLHHPAGHQRGQPRQPLRAGRHRAVDGLRHPAHDQLRPWRHDDGRRLRDAGAAARRHALRLGASLGGIVGGGAGRRRSSSASPTGRCAARRT